MAVVQKNSLTQPPTNLREAIDWILSFRGYGKGAKDMNAELASAVSDLTCFKVTFKDMFGGVSDPEGLIGNLGKGFQSFLGYYGTTAIDDFSGSGIVQNGYQSTYRNAHWNGVSDSKNMALIFLGCAVAVYYCIGYLYWRLNGGGWKNQTVSGSGIYLNNFLLAMGYSDGQLSTSGTGGDAIMGKVAQTFEELEKNTAAATNDYSAFLKNLEKIESNKALNRPLASCFLLADKYFASKNANDVTEAISAIRGKLETLSHNKEGWRSEALNPNPYDELKEYMQRLLSQAAIFQPKEAEKLAQGIHNAAGQAGKEVEKTESGQPSPAGAVAGTLTTLGFGGGAAAAYILDIGGAKTLVNGLLRIG